MRPTRGLLVTAAIVAACRPAGDALGPADSFVLLTPAEGAKVTTAGLPVMRRLDVLSSEAAPLVRQLNDGFGAEMLRTAYLAKQLVRELTVGERRFPDAQRGVAADPVVFVLGASAASGRGVAIERWLGGPDERPRIAWIGVGGDLDADRALVQTLTGAIASHVVALTTSSPDGVLSSGYRMAMEVIAREWRSGTGPQGAVAWDAGTATQRELFANVRENRAVVEGGRVRPAQALLKDPGVVAAVIYRMAQSKPIARRPAPAAFYAPIVTGRVPDGVSPAAVLGVFRNFQVKLLGAWARAILAGRPPADLVDLVEAYATTFPEERDEVIRLAVVTTFGGTAIEGGVPDALGDPAAATAALDALTREVLAGKRALRGR